MKLREPQIYRGTATGRSWVETAQARSSRILPNATSPGCWPSSKQRQRRLSIHHSVTFWDPVQGHQSYGEAISVVPLALVQPADPIFDLQFRRASRRVDMSMLPCVPHQSPACRSGLSFSEPLSTRVKKLEIPRGEVKDCTRRENRTGSQR